MWARLSTCEIIRAAVPYVREKAQEVSVFPASRRRKIAIIRLQTPVKKFRRLLTPGWISFPKVLAETRVQFFSMVKTAQSKAGMTTMFTLLIAFIPNFSLAYSFWRDAQSSNVSPQARAAQTTDKNDEALKARESLNRFLGVARKRAEEYNKLFRDLAAEEKRTSVLFKKSGEESERRQVICEFVVYQSRINSDLAFEYRNAKSIDGKRVSGQEKRMMTLFENLAKAETALRERYLINNESFSHDKVKFNFYGTVIYQWRELMDYARDSVEITYAGTEKIDGTQTVALEFQQTTRNKWLEWAPPPYYSGFEQRVRGRLWLDARTAQIRRAERELRLILPNASDPVPLWRQTFDYSQSDLGILVPKKFVYDLFFDFRRNHEGKMESFLTGRLVSEFGKFQRFTVSSSEEEKKTIIKDKPQSNDKKPET
ncbi:MAG: hypothetical protein J2P21_05575 [Chloracidobacterium sp.]|nr:hypothetical protein [Chloracidobacterium sp.]